MIVGEVYFPELTQVSRHNPITFHREGCQPVQIGFIRLDRDNTWSVNINGGLVEKKLPDYLEAKHCARTHCKFLGLIA